MKSSRKLYATNERFRPNHGKYTYARQQSWPGILSHGMTCETLGLDPTCLLLVRRSCLLAAKVYNALSSHDQDSWAYFPKIPLLISYTIDRSLQNCDTLKRRCNNKNLGKCVECRQVSRRKDVGSKATDAALLSLMVMGVHICQL